MASANDKQIKGTHYQIQSIQPWDYILANNLGFLEGNAIKYITRHTLKDGINDINKAIHYLEKLKETLEKKTKSSKQVHNTRTTKKRSSSSQQPKSVQERKRTKTKAKSSSTFPFDRS